MSRGGGAGGEPVGAYAVMHALAALEALALGALSVPELADRLGVHVRTARRLVRRLAADGYAVRVGSRPRYELTFAVAVLGYRALGGAAVPRIAAPFVAMAAAGSGWPAELWIRADDEVVRVLRAEPGGDFPVPVLDAHEGAGACAPGHVLLANDAECLAGLGPGRMPVRSGGVDTRDLRVELARVRGRGYAVEPAATAGRGRIAVAVRDSGVGLSLALELSGALLAEASRPAAQLHATAAALAAALRNSGRSAQATGA